MNRTECTLMDVAKKIEKDFLLIGLPITLKDFLTLEEYETFRFALKNILQDNYDKHWEVMNRIRQKVDKLAAAAPGIKLHAAFELIRKESLNSKPKFIGFESGVFDLLLKKVNEFISSDECKEFINFDFKITERSNQHFVYSGFVEYRSPEQDEDDSQKPHDAVKEFASGVRKTIEETYQSFGGSERFDFCDHGFALIEAIQNKLDEVLK